MERARPAWPRGRGAAVFVLLTVLVNWKEDRPDMRIAYTFLALLVTVLAQHWRRIYVVIVKLPRDIRVLSLFFQLFQHTNRLQRQNLTLVRCFTQNVLSHPEKICFYYEGGSWSYRKVDEYSNRVARLLHRAGYRKGDTVALVMGSSPEYVCTWLGMAKLGVVSALVNHNLLDVSLAHSINIVKPKAVIFDAQSADAVLAVRDRLTTVRTLYQSDGEPGAAVEDLQELLRHESDEDPVGLEEAKLSDPVVYVYTSGTTGLPKAAIVANTKFATGTYTFFLFASMNPEKDIIYSPLPLYHSAAGVYCTGIALMHGVPLVIARKFSVSRFWSDCIKYNVTMVQYIGEICRYLLSAPPTPAERQHRVHAFLGNGLQRSLWENMVERFNVRNIYELYGSTEGNIGMMNVDNTPGAVGVLPRILPLSVYPIAIVQADPKTGELIRDAVTNRCVRCEDNEVGMIIGKIDDSHPVKEFRGYVDPDSTQKKILRDVFTEGDRYFASGDLMVMDEYGYIYFRDRIGDTFRWKGENVSTSEVESVLSVALTNVSSVAVFGVEVPGSEGRAGMAVIVDPERKVDLELLAQRVQTSLPPYARPLFVRVTDSMPVTGTFKITKSNLQKEGYDISIVKDPVYFFNAQKREYIPLDTELLVDINSGRMRL